jgi:GTP-binding protein EngB required for normal cell division
MSVFDAFNQRRSEVVDALAELATLAERADTRSLAERFGRDVVQKLREDRFHLVVVGEFNHGKTTFVNALLGRPVLPVGVTPTTALIHHVGWAAEPRAALVRADGSREDIAVEALGRYVVGAAGALDGDGAEKALEHAIQYLEVGWPAELLRERIVLVDTPGVNDLCLQRADVTYRYIPQADAVLFVIDAGQPLKESERLFLRDKLIGQSRDNIIFVVCKADIWSAEERREALAYIRKELDKLVEGPVIFAASPQRALAGDAEAGGLGPLCAHLNAFLAEERGRILLDNALGEGLEAARALSHALDARRRAARMSVEEIERRIGRIEQDLNGQQRTLEERRAAIREETAAIRAWLRRDLDRFADDVVRELPAVCEKAELASLQQYLGGFLESTFERWATAEAAEVAQALEALADRTVAMVRDDAREAAERLSETFEVRAPDVKIDTFGYDLGVAALFSVGLGMVFTNLLLGVLMAGAAPVLAYYLRGRIEIQTRQKAREQADLAVREAAQKVGPKLEEMIEDFAKRLDAWVVETGRALHREMLDVLRAALRERAHAKPDAEAESRRSEELGAALASLRGRIEGLRAQLWD